MDTELLSAILLLAGAGALVVAFVVGPKGIYEEPDLPKRVEIIEEAKSGWNISQSLLSLSVVLTAAGFVALAYFLNDLQNAWIPGLGAIAFVVGAITADIFIYRQTVDPLASYEGAYTNMEMLYYWLALAGLLLFGIAFLQSELPEWLGWVTFGATVIYGIVFTVVRSIRWSTPGLVFLLSLVIGIFLLTQ
jgi:hypothetical protein